MKIGQLNKFTFGIHAWWYLPEYDRLRVYDTIHGQCVAEWALHNLVPYCVVNTLPTNVAKQFEEVVESWKKWVQSIIKVTTT